MVLGDALERFTDKADAPGDQVVLAAEIIEDVTRLRVRRQGVDGEVAAGRIFFPVVGENDRRSPSVRGYVTTQRRHLVRASAADSRHRSVIDARGDGPNLGRLQPRDHLVGSQPCREVEVADRQVQEFVTNRAAHVAGQAFLCSESVKQAGHASLTTPPVGIDLQLHCSLRDRLTIIAAVAPQIFRSFHTIS